MPTSELRRSHIWNDWVIVSSDREQRPMDLVGDRADLPLRSDCPFCPGNEFMTPSEVFAIRGKTPPNGPGWSVRVFPNRYPAVRSDGDSRIRCGDSHCRMEGLGMHEVVVDTPDHDASMAEMAEDHIASVLITYKERYDHIASDGRFKSILVFKNQGLEAGASQHHSHSQIIALPFVPEQISHELHDCSEHSMGKGEGCAYDDLVRDERDSRVRMVIDEGKFSVHCPFASRFPFEVLVVPKKHAPSFVAADDSELESLAKVLRDTLRRYAKILDRPAYNMYIHSAPCDGYEHRYYHWHVHIAPKSIKFGSFEIGSGVYINSLPPERSAEALRSAGP